MKRIKQALRSFFSPPASVRLWRKLIPWASLAVVLVLVFSGGSTVWEYTNSPQFCGTSCHTMPPEYTAYLTSPHARILCVECHIGRDFMGGGFLLRKAGDLKHVFATVFTTYKFPIRADAMRPARETCERCHSPEKFSADKLFEIKRFGNDVNNTPTSTFITLKTGGGVKRPGQNMGIHWHVQSTVYYLPTDEQEQTIPFVRVVGDDGQNTDYFDAGTDLNSTTVDTSKLKKMDCITCHNRITHLILPPDDRVDQLLALGLVDKTIPEIRYKAVEVLSASYATSQQGLAAIAGLKGYYQTTYADYFASHSDLLATAVSALQNAYTDSTFPEQKVDWQTHANNVGHRLTPGCFRCHDGKHLNNQQASIPLECNLCHSIPAVVGPDKFVANIEISRGPEPASHLSSNWLGQHRDAFNEPFCSACHTTQNPGGTDNSSFCSNSGCHGNQWQYAGLNAPGVREILLKQLPPTPTPLPSTPTPLPGASTPAAPAPSTGALTYNATIGAIFQARCSACHNAGALAGLDLLTYASAMKGGQDGAVIVPGDSAASLLIKKQSGTTPHFGQLSLTELQQVTAWIKAGALEK